MYTLFFKLLQKSDHILRDHHLHGPPHGPGPWTTLNFFPWTTPNFQKEIAPVNMEIYPRSGNEKHRLVFIAYVLEGCLGSCRHKWEDHKLFLRYRRSSAFLP